MPAMPSNLVGVGRQKHSLPLNRLQSASIGGDRCGNNCFFSWKEHLVDNTVRFRGVLEMNRLIGGIVIFLLLNSVLPVFGAEDSSHHDVVHGHKTNPDHSKETKERMERLVKKLCSPPQPFADVRALERMDACGASMFYGRTNLRNCFTVFMGFRERISLQAMYAIDACMFTEEKRAEANKFVNQCLAAISKVTPKYELIQLGKKYSSLKTNEEKKKFVQEITDLRLTCEERALGL